VRYVLRRGEFADLDFLFSVMNSLSDWFRRLSLDISGQSTRRIIMQGVSRLAFEWKVMSMLKWAHSVL
jgi:hypothetical protein